MLMPKRGKREPRIPELPRTPRQLRIAEKLAVSPAISRRNESMLIPPSLIERLGAALNGGKCRLILDRRGNRICMSLSLNVPFQEIESSRMIFEIFFPNEVPRWDLKLKSWSIERQELVITTDFPQEVKEVKEGAVIVLSAEIESKKPVAWSTRIVSVKPARYF